MAKLNPASCDHALSLYWCALSQGASAEEASAVLADWEKFEIPLPF